MVVYKFLYLYVYRCVCALLLFIAVVLKMAAMHALTACLLAVTFTCIFAFVSVYSNIFSYFSCYNMTKPLSFICMRACVCVCVWLFRIRCALLLLSFSLYFIILLLLIFICHFRHLQLHWLLSVHMLNQNYCQHIVTVMLICYVI